MTLTTDTSKFLTNELRSIVKKEGLNGEIVMKRVAQLRKQGYVVVVNGNQNGKNWRVYELDR